MIARIWHGWTKSEDAATYENLLRSEVIPSIEDKKIKGFKKISHQLARASRSGH